MKINVVKIHKILTFLGVTGLLIGALFFFFSEVDQTFRLNILPQMLENIVMLIAILCGTISIPSLITSIVLSLYRLSDKE